MTKRLYRVTVEHVLYVMAEDWVEASDIAERECSEEQPTYISHQEVEPGHKPDEAWAHGSLPWGGDDERSVVDIIKEMEVGE